MKEKFELGYTHNGVPQNAWLTVIMGLSGPLAFLEVCFIVPTLLLWSLKGGIGGLIVLTLLFGLGDFSWHFRGNPMKSMWRIGFDEYETTMDEVKMKEN